MFLYVTTPMFIKDVIMDGFKCYTKKTIVKNLDKSFTCITGMNGSGKSNIIDAIIFTLDLSTSKYMRVSNLKELININRKECTVSIIFDNSEKNKSPAGYESYETIEISRSLDFEGKSKYKLNGHNSTKNSIENLCKSIGITNDFIVMQGHITKIINMKNSDLKNMIEETAGTKNYNSEREKSLELLQKKEFKLKEAREHLKRTISPFFDQLKNEKRLYEENRDIEMNRKKYNEELERLENQKMAIEVSSKVEELKNMGLKYFNEKIELENLEMKIKEINSTPTVNLTDLNASINREKDRLEDLKAQDPSDQIYRKNKEYEEYQNILKNKLKFDLIELKEKEGLLSNELVGGGNKIDELEDLKAELNKKQIRFDILNNDIENMLKNTQIINDNMNNIVDEYDANITKIKSIEENISALKSKIIYPIIDGVYGTVDENFDFIDEKYKEAILTILGGRSKFVICRDEDIASTVIQNNDRKVSCIPLNKISYFEPKKVPFSCINALDAINFDQKYSKAFKHIFSGFYIFEDKTKASACCFECKVVCVTLDGTVYDPKGTLTGGKSFNKYDVTRMKDIKRLETELESLKLGIPNNINDLRAILKAQNEKSNLLKNISTLNSKINMLQGLVSSKINVKEELKAIRNMIVEATKEDKVRSIAIEKSNILKGEISNLINIKNDLENQIEITKSKINQLQAQQKTCELEDTSKRASIRMMDSYNENYKNLIKSTVKLSSRITRLYEEIKPIINQTQENNTNIQIRNENNEDFINFMCENFNIGKNVLLFNFNSSNINQKELEERITFLKEKVFKKRLVVNMDPSNFELLEKNAVAVQDLEEKILKLENDRIEIIKSIEKLNEMGVKENLKAFEHINRILRVFLGYFLKNSDIFISPEFVIKVKVGNWKNSLSELSGGQKSLIALCLMFSMLTFRPAPFYIFDEIDAALDLNYTQSIGEIIQREFEGAQFIVVSLKNNMFENANRIFKVYIQDHESKICQIK